VERAHGKPINRPADLDLSPEVFDVLFKALTEHGRANFDRDLLRAIQQAQQRNNLRPVREVLEAWYRTLVVRQHPDYEGSLEWARQNKEQDAVPVEEFLRAIEP
jgi:Family of unknown function (DUF6247)